MNAKSSLIGILGLLLLGVPGAARATPCSYTCPSQDNAGFALGQSDPGPPLFCSYPTFAGEDPNDFPASDSVTLPNKTKGEVSFDVTADVKNGKSEWLLKAASDRLSAGVQFYSREGAAAASKPSLGPHSELDY